MSPEDTYMVIRIKLSFRDIIDFPGPYNKASLAAILSKRGMLINESNDAKRWLGTVVVYEDFERHCMVYTQYVPCPTSAKVIK